MVMSDSKGNPDVKFVGSVTWSRPVRGDAVNADELGCA